MSGREIDTWTKSNAGTVDWNWMTPAKIARFYGTRASHELNEDHVKRKGDGPVIAAPLEAFEADPVATRQQLRELPHLRNPHWRDFCPGDLPL